MSLAPQIDKQSAYMLLWFLASMSASHHPWQVLSARVGTGMLTPGWNLHEPEPSEAGAREFRVEIPFATPFFKAPVVHLGLVGFDVDRADNGRISLRAEDITTRGFAAVIVTWASTRVYAVEFDWLAIGNQRVGCEW